MEKFVKFLPAWDKRNSTPNKDFGINSVRIYFCIKGEKGAIQFVLATGWNLPHVKKEFLGKTNNDLFPLAMDVSYHSPVPMYDGQQPISSTCELLGDKTCYCGGSGSEVEKYLEALIEHGSDRVWDMLIDEYCHRFNVEKEETT